MSKDSDIDIAGFSLSVMLSHKNFRNITAYNLGTLYMHLTPYTSIKKTLIPLGFEKWKGCI